LIKSKPQAIKRLLGLSIFGLIVVVFVVYLRNNLADFKRLSFVNPSYVILLIGLALLNSYVLGLAMRVVLLPFRVFLGGTEAFFVSIANSFYNYITPFRAGAAGRAVYLKDKHRLPYVHFLATFSANSLLSFLAASFCGIVATLWISWEEGILSWILLCVFVSIFVTLMLIVILSPQLNESPHKWLNRFVQVINGWRRIRNEGRILASIFLLMSALLLMQSIGNRLMFLVFGIVVSFPKCLFLASISQLSLLISITPANLGISEAITVFSATTIGIAPAEALPAAILGRLISFLVLFSLGPIATHYLIRYEPELHR